MAHQPKELPEILRWGGWRNPNPPDPWLELILEIGDPQIRQAAVSELVKMNIATARIQGEFWTGIQRAMAPKADQNRDREKPPVVKPNAWRFLTGSARSARYGPVRIADCF